MAKLKLQKYCKFQGSLVTRSGLRIGGSQEEMEIGGIDNPIIRDPVSNLPYIPGSSLKGKLRSLLEYKLGKVSANGEPCGCGQPDCMVCLVFGPHKNTRHSLGPTRIIVRDAPLSPESLGVLERQVREGGRYAEAKKEVWIDRRTGIAGQGGLRTQERLPAGAKFDLEISLRIFEEDGDGKKLTNFVKDGLDMLQQDYLGGSGTRGYGWVNIEDLKITDSKVESDQQKKL